MNILNTFIVFVIASSSFGQTVSELLNSGVNKQNKQDYKEAIKDYDKALKIDKDLEEAYYNIGTCKLALKDFEGAILSLEKAIEINPKYFKAYYNKAVVFISQEKYIESLPTLNKLIELDATFPNALTLRGQILAQTGDKKGACEDFTAAKTNGDKKATEYLNQFCGNEQQAGESLMLHWPESENWKIGSSKEDENSAVMELIHADEKLESWTEFGYMSSIKGVKNVDMDQAMNLMFEQTKINAPKAQLTFIEKDETVECPWIIFAIECPNFKNDKTPESQLWCIVQGKTSLYTNFRAVKEVTIPEDKLTKWTAFFKTGKIVYSEE